MIKRHSGFPVLIGVLVVFCFGAIRYAKHLKIGPIQAVDDKNDQLHQKNTSPDTPSNASPSDGATEQSINVDLSWIGGDPDPGDSVTYGDLVLPKFDNTIHILSLSISLG